MIFQLTFSDKKEFVSGSSMKHVLTEYEKEYGNEVNEIRAIKEITPKQQKRIKLKCDEEEKLIPLEAWESSDFTVFGGTEFD